MATTQLRFKNTTPHILGITCAGGWVQNVPPKFEAPDGVVFTLDESTRSWVDKAVATPTVQAWIGAGELVVTEVSTVRFVNRSNRTITIPLGAGFDTVVIPPDGVKVTFEGGEPAALDKALKTPAVQKLIAAGELLVQDVTPVEQPAA